MQLTRREPTDRPGIFFITSCNFTQEELERKFVPAGFAVEHVVPAPMFMFVRRSAYAGRPKRFHRHDRGLPADIDHVIDTKVVVCLSSRCRRMETCACVCRTRRVRS